MTLTRDTVPTVIEDEISIPIPPTWEKSSCDANSVMVKSLLQRLKLVSKKFGMRIITNGSIICCDTTRKEKFVQEGSLRHD